VISTNAFNTSITVMPELPLLFVPLLGARILLASEQRTLWQPAHPPWPTCVVPNDASRQQAAMDDGSVGVGAEMAFEATYQAQINKWLSIQPKLQYTINLGGNQDHQNALVIGCRLSLTF
jgi:carbohydrate-selective porin (OprB family)